MYISPELHRIGDAEEIVLGTTDYGLDLDGTNIMPGGEFPFPDPSTPND